jgi:uncharacterized LabA/DUF88 family protein
MKTSTTQKKKTLIALESINLSICVAIQLESQEGQQKLRSKIKSKIDCSVALQKERKRKEKLINIFFCHVALALKKLKAKQKKGLTAERIITYYIFNQNQNKDE